MLLALSEIDIFTFSVDVKSGSRPMCAIIFVADVSLVSFICGFFFFTSIKLYLNAVPTAHSGTTVGAGHKKSGKSNYRLRKSIRRVADRFTLFSPDIILCGRLGSKYRLIN